MVSLRERERARQSIGFLLPSPSFTHRSGTQSVRWYSTYCFSHRAYMGHVLAFFFTGLFYSLICDSVSSFKEILCLFPSFEHLCLDCVVEV